MIPIIPALIPKDEADVRHTLERLSFSNEIHFDVVDGVLAGKASWPYNTKASPVDVRAYTDQFSLEVDLMTADPLPAAIEWITAGADMLVFHLETISLDNFKNVEAFTHVTVGVSAHGETTLDALLEYAKYSDYIQLMGIYEIGAMQQPFDDTVLDKIKALKASFPDKTVSVDGSVNADTIKRLADAGADRFVVGSAITMQTNPRSAHAELSALIN